jgi:hypothetical protein
VTYVCRVLLGSESDARACRVWHTPIPSTSPSRPGHNRPSCSAAPCPLSGCKRVTTVPAAQQLPAHCQVASVPGQPSPYERDGGSAGTRIHARTCSACLLLSLHLRSAALRLPWWTLAKDFAAVAAVAELDRPELAEDASSPTPAAVGRPNAAASADGSRKGPTPQRIRYLLSDDAAAEAQVGVMPCCCLPG